MQLKFGWDEIGNCLRRIPMRCNCILADTVWNCLRINDKSDQKQLNFGQDRFCNCLRTIPMRCNWILADTDFRIVLE